MGDYMYKTCDLYLASFLKTMGHEITGIERVEKKCYFSFKCEEKDALAFYNNVKIGALAFKNTIQELKTIVMHG
jgi:Domain of unknown function (DUF5659)